MASRKGRTGCSYRSHEPLPVLKESEACPKSTSGWFARSKPKQESQWNRLNEREARFPHRRKDAIGSKTDEGQEDKPEPSKRHINRWNLIRVALDVLLLDAPLLTHIVKGIHKKLCGDGQKPDSNCNSAQTNP